MLDHEMEQYGSLKLALDKEGKAAAAGEEQGH